MLTLTPILVTLRIFTTKQTIYYKEHTAGNEAYVNTLQATSAPVR